jgi:hypothetical protein
MAKQSTDLRERVTTAADMVLRTQGSAGPLELLQQMSLLAPSQVTAWRKGILESLAGGIQGSPKKLSLAFGFFKQWARDRGLTSVEEPYTRATPAGPVALHVTRDADPDQEQFFCTHYVRRSTSERKMKNTAAKLAKPPDLVVFQTVSQSVPCSECKREMLKNDFLFMEKRQPLCLACADLDHLEFLPSGDATLTRRARKHSPLSAVVVRFSRSRNRYERQGILVASEAIEKAEWECEADHGLRMARRPIQALRREKEDRGLQAAMAQAIREMYPGCPKQETERIAQHTAERGSGRVGRSGAGRGLDPGALHLAVKAWIRHNHTGYDELLMKGVDRLEARDMVGDKISDWLTKWSKDE